VTDLLTAEAADWIRTVVLRDQDDALIRLCRCQYGACGACVADRHDLCADPRIVGPDTHLFGRVEAVRVWRSGTPCTWRCACECRKPKTVEPEPLGQLELFALAGGAS
jgi:hypothetical protein